jgi:hypothetical protein
MSVSGEIDTAGVGVRRLAVMRRFVLDRVEDLSGLSGTGTVAEGVEFWNGQVALTWRSPWTVVSVFPSIELVQDIHGRGGRAHVVWLDKEHQPEPPDLSHYER